MGIDFKNFSRLKLSPLLCFWNYCLVFHLSLLLSSFFLFSHSGTFTFQIPSVYSYSLILLLFTKITISSICFTFSNNPANNMQNLKYIFSSLFSYVSSKVSIFIWLQSFYFMPPILQIDQLTDSVYSKALGLSSWYVLPSLLYK